MKAVAAPAMAIVLYGKPLFRDGFPGTGVENKLASRNREGRSCVIPFGGRNMVCVVIFIRCKDICMYIHQ